MNTATNSPTEEKLEGDHDLPTCTNDEKKLPKRVPVVYQMKKSTKWFTRSTVGQILLFTITVGCTVASIIGTYLAYDSQITKLDTTVIISEVARRTGGIVLVGSMQSIDPVAQTASILFDIEGYGNYATSGNYSDVNVNFDIFAEGGKTPVMSYNTTLADYGLRQTVSFKMPLTGLTRNDKDYQAAQRRPTLVNYPFDSYSADVSMAARITSTNGTIPFFNTTMYGNVQGWVTRSFQVNSSYASANGYITEEGMYMQFEFQRAAAIQAFAIIMAVVMWLVTLIVLYLTLLGTIYSYNLPPPFIIVPVTVLFALPGIRGIMPAVPAFGTYLDVCSILLCELIVSLSFVLLSLNYVMRIGLPRFAKTHAA